MLHFQVPGFDVSNKNIFVAFKKHYLIPENFTKLEVFWHFQGVYIDMKQYSEMV